jgi:hypothetical protein
VDLRAPAFFAAGLSLLNLLLVGLLKLGINWEAKRK